MADLSKTIEIIFGGNDQVSKIVDGIGSKITGLSSVTEAVAAPLAGIADGILKADAALTALAVGGLAYAIKSGGEFSSQLSEVNTMANMTAGELTGFSADVMAYAKNSTQSIDNINGSIYQAISLGVSWENSLTALSDAEKLAVGGKADLAASTELLLGTMNAYGDGVEEAGRYSDAFFTIVKDGKTTVPELAASMSQVTSIAAAGEVPIETLGSAIAALTASGAPTSEAMTKIKAVIENIIKPSAAAEKAAAALGLEFSGQALAANGLDGMLQKVYKSTGGNIDVMSELFGSTEALQAALVLGADKSGVFARAMEDMANKAGATEAAYQMMVNSIENDNQRLANNVDLVFTRIGLKIESQRHDVTTAITEMFAGIATGIDEGAFDELFAAISGFGDKAAKLISDIAKVLPEAMNEVDFDDLIAAFGIAGDKVAEYFEGVDLTTAQGLATALQGVVDTITALVNVTGGMVDAFRPYFDAMTEAIDRANDMDAETAKSFGNVLLGAKMVVEAGAGIALAFAAMGQSGTEMGAVFDVVFGSIRVVWNTLETAFHSVALTVVQGLYTIVDAADTINKALGLDGFVGSLEGAKKSLIDLENAIHAEQMSDMEQGVAGAAQAWAGLTGQTDKAKESLASVGTQAEKTREWLDGVSSIELADLAFKAILDSSPAEKALADMPKKTEAARTLSLTGNFDPENLAAANAMLNSAIPVERESKVVAKVDEEELKIAIERLKAQTSLAESAMEWTAKVDIAQAEAAADRVQAAFASVSSTIENTGSTLVGLWSTMENLSLSDQMDLASNIRDEMSMRQEAFDLQKRLTEAEIALTESRVRSVDQGNGLIKITADGLEPELEAFMWKIIEKVQIRGVEENAEFLLGLD